MQPEIAIPVGAQDDRPRTSDALQALKASGRRLGRPIEQNAETMARIAAEHADGRSLRSIAAGLTADKVPTARSGLW